MPENNAKRIICLANSRKLGGRCVAGREAFAPGSYGGWIRPVSGRQGAAVSLEERRYQDGTDPQVLDVINIQMIGPAPRLHQTENHLLNDQFYWQREGYNHFGNSFEVKMQGTVFTIGHSTHSQEKFLELLAMHRITAICDVRSMPFSRVNPQFNRKELKNVLNANGIEYVFLGKELGARSDDDDCYVNGKVQYDRLAHTNLFKQGIQRIQKGMEGYRLALMCAEKEPLECHRSILVSRHLTESGIEVRHIHATGKIESHEDALNRLVHMLKLSQGDMFKDAFAVAYRKQEERIAYEKTEEAPAPTVPAAGAFG